MLKIILPTYVDVKRSKKNKRVYANLNVYRNLHHITNNDAKHMYKDIVWEQLESMELKALREPVRVIVTLYAPDKRDRDLGNFCSIAQKYCDDAIVEYGLLTDDNVKYLKECVYKYGGIDKNFPRFEVEYEEINIQNEKDYSDMIEITDDVKW